MRVLVVLTLLYLAETCLGGNYYGNYPPGPPGYVAEVEGECGCCPPPCCCTCIESGVAPTRPPTTTEKPMTTTTAEIICDFKLDLAFVMDESGSIGDDDWLVAKQFVSDVTSTFQDIGNDGTLVGMVTYSNNATMHWNFASQETQSAAALSKAIMALPIAGGFTNTPDGLYTANTEVFNTYGDRDWPDDSDAVPNVCLVMTDGRANYELHNYPLYTAALKDTATVVVIGITTNINMTELRLIASDDSLVFTVDDFKSLTGILNDIKIAVCPTPKIVTTTTTTTPPPPPPPKKECFCCCPPPPGYPEIGYEQVMYAKPKHGYRPPYGCPC